MEPIINPKYRGTDALALTRLNDSYSFSIGVSIDGSSSLEALKQEIEGMKDAIISKRNFEVLMKYSNVNLERVEPKISGAIKMLERDEKIDLVRLLEN